MRLMNKLIAYSDKPITSNKIGSWRFVEPYLQDKIPPCSAHCPLKHDIREVFSLIKDGFGEKAFFLMAERNPILYSTGKVCPHFCEGECNREFIDESLFISSVESYLGRNYLYKDLKCFRKSKTLNKKIAIIGGGPAGLSAAYQLGMYSADVELFEKESELGGVLMFGIPDIRVNKSFFKTEIERLIESFPNIKVHLNQNILKANIQDMVKEYDYILLAPGLHSPIKSSFNHVSYGLDALKAFHKGEKKIPQNGHYLILGGGNTSMDVAQYLLDQDNRVSILVRKEREKMTAFPDEIWIVEGKGGKIYPSTELKSWDPIKREGVVQKDKFEEVWDVDGIFICFGQKPEDLWSEFQENTAKIKRIGDLASEDFTVVHAIASGYDMAHDILVENSIVLKKERNLEIAGKSMINIDYWKTKKEKRQIKTHLDPLKVISSESIIKESERCIQCGTCTACGVCETFCPDFAISMSENAEINYDYCKGCEICSEECPSGVLSIREVEN